MSFGGVKNRPRCTVASSRRPNGLQGLARASKMPSPEPPKCLHLSFQNAFAVWLRPTAAQHSPSLVFTWSTRWQSRIASPLQWKLWFFVLQISQFCENWNHNFRCRGISFFFSKCIVTDFCNSGGLGACKYHACHKPLYCDFPGRFVLPRCEITKICFPRNDVRLSQISCSGVSASDVWFASIV